jgi:N utilization substance protein A
LDQNLKVILQQLEAEKNVNRDTLLEAIRSAIESAARKSMSGMGDISVEVDPDTLTFKVFDIRSVAETVEDEVNEISLEDALELNPAVKLGNRLKVPTEPKNFGRIAAQTAKQVIIQKIKDAERDNIYDEFKQREGEILTGTVKRVSHGNIVVTIGRAEAIVPYREQSPRETFKPGDRIRAYLLEVEKSPRGAQLILSRTSQELVRGLFELEVPELYDGTVNIKAIAREPGSRTKVAVLSRDPNVDAVGACVGMKGARVRSVVEELSGEKIDIVRWSENVSELCAAALNPADILDLQTDEESGVIRVLVPQDQLSLAIGKRGQNARLASKLIGWNIDISGDGESESSFEEEDIDGAEDLVTAEDDMVLDTDEVADGEVSADEPQADAEETADAVEASEPDGADGEVDGEVDGDGEKSG